MGPATALAACFVVFAPQDAVPARHRVAGVVLDRQGKPWADARVVLFARAVPAFAWVGDTDVVHATTDARGRFRARISAVRRYSVWAFSEPKAGRYRVTGIVENVIGRVPIRLKEQPGVRHAAAVRLAGLDKWRHRGALFLRVWSPHPRNVFVVDLPLDDAARATLPALPGDGCFVDVFGKDRYPILSVFVPSTDARWRRYSSPRDLCVRDGKGVVTIDLPPPGQVRVFVKDKAGKGVPGAQVRRDLVLARALFDPVGVTGPDGVVQLDVPSGIPTVLQVVAGKEGFTHRFRLQQVTVDAGKEHAKPIVLAIDKATTLRGRILYGPGTPAANLALLVRSAVPSNDGSTYQNWIGPMAYRTDREGRFAIPGRLAKFGFWLTAVPTVAQLARTELAGLAASEILLRADARGNGDDETLGDVRIDELQRVDLRVTGSEPVDRVAVQVAPLSKAGVQPYYALRLQTDRRGHAAMLAPPGSRWALTAGQNGIRASVELALPKDKKPTVETRIELSRGRLVSGRVLSSDGHPVAGARVQLLRARYRGRRAGQPGAIAGNASTMRTASRTWVCFVGGEFVSGQSSLYRRSRLWDWFAPVADHVKTDAGGGFTLALPKGVSMAWIVATSLGADGELLQSEESTLQDSALPIEKLELRLQ